MKHLIPTLLTTILLALTACDNGWSSTEQELINAAQYSRMRVTKVNDQADSLFLREKCKPLTRGQLATPEFGRLVASMIETVNDSDNAGVGIAAPQVGISRRVVVVQRVDKAGKPFEVYVNPEITAYGEPRVMGSEGCLSVPGLRGKVERSRSIDIAWRDAVTFEPRTEHIEGFVAVIFQHEIDHLDGIIYTDRAAEVIARE